MAHEAERKPRVLYVSHTAHWGGAEIVLARFLAQARQIEGMVLLPHGAFAERLRALALPYRTTHTLGNLRREQHRWSWTVLLFWRFVLAQWGLVYWLWRLRPDVVQANNYISAWYLAFPVRFLRKPLVVHMHDILASRGRRMWLLRRLLRDQDVLFAVSEAVARSLREGGVSPAQIQVVYNHIDRPAEVSGRERSARRMRPPVFGVMGNIEPRKGIREVVEALSILQRRTREVEEVPRLRIAGEAYTPLQHAYATEIRSIIQERGLAEKVEWLGFVSDGTLFFRSLDFFVHYPAEEEPFGMVLLEAVSHGCPVIAADAGGCAECLDDGRWGQLVPPRNPEALAEVLWDALHHPPPPLTKEELTAFFDRFSLARKEAAHLRVYRRLTQARLA